MPVPAAPALLAAAPYIVKGLDTVGNFLSGLFTNDSNLKAVRENNATQIMLANQKWNRDVQMWNMQNAYNDPSAQAERMRNAGINPFLAGVSTGTAQTAPTAPLPSTQAAQYQQPTFDTSQLADMLFNRNMMNKEVESRELDNEGKRIDNKYKEAMTIAALNDITSRNEGTKLTNYATKLQNDFFEQTRDNRLKMLGEEVNQRVLENDALRQNLKFLPKEKQLGVQLLAGQVAKIAVENQLSRAQISKLVFDSKFVQQSIEGLKLDNKQKDAVMNTMIRTAEYNMIKTSWDARDSKWRSEHSKNNRYSDNPFQESHNQFGGSLYRGGKMVTDMFNIFK